MWRTEFSELLIRAKKRISNNEQGMSNDEVWVTEAVRQLAKTVIPDESRPVADEIRNPERISNFSFLHDFNLFWISTRAPRFVKSHEKSLDLAGMTIYGAGCLGGSLKG